MTEGKNVEGEFRVEKDSMGEVLVPATALWGAQTQRAIANFPISGERMPAVLIKALLLVKKHAAAANAELGVIDPEVGKAIGEAVDELLASNYMDHFPLDVFQTGSGTSTNMNANEVIARMVELRTGRRVSPNDVVNASQSSNDVFPTAIHVAVVLLAKERTLPASRRLSEALSAKAVEFGEVVKAGRTHLMDATPVTLGQEFGSYATAVSRGAKALEEALEEVAELPLGGTAVGTGINAPEGFARLTIERLSSEVGFGFREAEDHFEAQAFRGGVLAVSAATRGLAVALYKVANDIRWMGSGPAAGLAEIFLPDLQPGSSIMPGKVNPVIPEALCQVAAQVIGNDAVVAFAASQGNFELNVMMPVMARNLLSSLELLASAQAVFAEKCVEGIRANVERCRANAYASPAVATALNPYFGYQKVAELIKRAQDEGRDLKAMLVEEGLLDEATATRALDIRRMTRGGILKEG
jgi:fumarate hydratase class II